MAPKYVWHSENIDGFFRRLQFDKDQKRKYTDALCDLQFALKGSPYWIEYVVTQQDKSQYSYDGTFINSGRMPSIPETYLAWVKPKLERNRNAVLIGIKELHLDQR